MARLTFSDLYEVVAGWNPDQKRSRVKALANLIIRELNLIEVGFTRTRTTFTTTASESITVGATKSSATVTYASAASSHVGQVIQVTGSDTWYTIDSVSAGVSFTLSSGFEGETGASLSAELAYPRVVLPEALLDIDDISREGRIPLLLLTDEMTPFTGNAEKATREPSAYFEVEPLNADDSKEIMLVDPPDAVYTYTVTGKNRIARYTEDSSRAGIPEKWEHVLLAGTLFYAIDQEDGAAESSFWGRVYLALKKQLEKGDGPSYRGQVERMMVGRHHPQLRIPNLATE